MTYPLMTDDLCLIIPAYNEEKTINSIIQKTKLIGSTVVIDDCSQDGTNKIVSNLDIKVLNHKKNKGYQESIMTGIRFAKESNFQFLISIDADGELPTEELSKFKNKMAQGYDVVIGIRSQKNRHLEVLFGILGRLLWGINDPMCGIKGYNLDKIDYLDLFPKKDTFATELLFKQLKKGLTNYQIPLNVKKRKSASKVGNNLKVQIKIIQSIFISIYNKIF